MKIYHYTTIPALFEIIKSRSLLLTSLQNMNDTEEGGYSPSKFLEDFNAVETSDNTNSKLLFDFLRTTISEHKETFVELCKLPTEPYSLSFSIKQDNLSHWERYADDMEGVCISFDLDELQRLNNSNFPEFTIGRIFYDEQERKFQIQKRIIEFYNELFLHNDNEKQENPILTMGKNSVAHVAAIYQSMVYFVKNDYWNDEDEIRLLYDDISWKGRKKFLLSSEDMDLKSLQDAIVQHHKMLGLNKLEFNLFSSIRPCKRLLLKSVWTDKLIPEICLGTKCLQNKDDLYYFLKGNGLRNTKISESRIKIR